MNTNLAHNHNNIFARNDQKVNLKGHRQRLAEIYGKLESNKNANGIICQDYMKIKRQLENNKEVTNEFNAQEKQIGIRSENMVLLNKLRDISQGKQSVYGQKVMRNTFNMGGGNSSFFHDIGQRPSSETLMQGSVNVDDRSFDALMQNSTQSKASDGVSPANRFKQIRNSSKMDYNNNSFNVTQNDFLVQQTAGNISTITSMDTNLSQIQPRSLNFIKKKQEAERIDRENSQLLAKLKSTAVASCLDTKQLHNDHKKIQNMKRIIQGTSNRFTDIEKVFTAREHRYSVIPSRPLYLPPMYEMSADVVKAQKTTHSIEQLHNLKNKEQKYRNQFKNRRQTTEPVAMTPLTMGDFKNQMGNKSGEKIKPQMKPMNAAQSILQQIQGSIVTGGKPLPPMPNQDFKIQQHQDNIIEQQPSNIPKLSPLKYKSTGQHQALEQVVEQEPSLPSKKSDFRESEYHNNIELNTQSEQTENSKVRQGENQTTSEQYSDLHSASNNEQQRSSMRQTGQDEKESSGKASSSGGISGGKAQTPDNLEEDEDYTEEHYTTDMQNQASDDATSGLPSQVRPTNPERDNEEISQIRSSNFQSKVSHYPSEQNMEKKSNQSHYGTKKSAQSHYTNDKVQAVVSSEDEKYSEEIPTPKDNTDNTHTPHNRSSVLQDETPRSKEQKSSIVGGNEDLDNSDENEDNYSEESNNDEQQQEYEKKSSSMVQMESVKNSQMESVKNSSKGGIASSFQKSSKHDSQLNVPSKKDEADSEKKSSEASESSSEKSEDVQRQPYVEPPELSSDEESEKVQRQAYASSNAYSQSEFEKSQKSLASAAKSSDQNEYKSSVKSKQKSNSSMQKSSKKSQSYAKSSAQASNAQKSEYSSNNVSKEFSKAATDKSVSQKDHVSQKTQQTVPVVGKGGSEFRNYEQQRVSFDKSQGLQEQSSMKQVSLARNQLSVADNLMLPRGQDGLSSMSDKNVASQSPPQKNDIRKLINDQTMASAQNNAQSSPQGSRSPTNMASENVRSDNRIEGTQGSRTSGSRTVVGQAAAPTIGKEASSHKVLISGGKATPANDKIDSEEEYSEYSDDN